MASSRKSPRRNDRGELNRIFERALEDILARVCVSADGTPTLALAYSGGLDSTLLLHLARDFAVARGLPLHALHIHHGLNAGADAWRAHCRAQAERLGVPFHAAQVTIDRRDAGGIEQAARIVRYRRLGELCRQLGAGILLTGHHQDDQAETVLLQLLRGAGLPGLSAMPAWQPDDDLLGGGVALARPLLEVPRAALQQAASERQLAYVNDDSNDDPRYRRNGVRHRLFPALQAESPGFPARLARVAGHMQAAQRLLDELAQADLAACADATDGAALALPALARLSDERAANLLRHWLARQGQTAPSSARLREILWQMTQAAADAHPLFDFGAWRLHRIGDQLRLLPALPAITPQPIALTWRGEAEIVVPQWGGRLLFQPVAGGGLAPERLRAGPLELRARAGAERFKPAPERPSKTLKQAYQENAVPHWQRERLPLAYLQQRLVFVAGVGMDARAADAGAGIALHWQIDGVTPTNL